MIHRTTILMTEFITHDVKRFIVSKPEGFNFTPGQGVELTIDMNNWREEGGRPFTPTNLADDQVLEFIIKRYSDHKGVTDKLHTLGPGDNLRISAPFGTISYKGPGTFIAAGSGVTPFLSIFRQLAVDKGLEQQVLIFSNKTPADVICEKELVHYFGNRCHLLCTRENGPGYENLHIDHDYLKENLINTDQQVYVCGPKTFVEEINAILKELGFSSESIVYEE